MGLLQMVAENKTAETMKKKKKSGGAPKCSVCDSVMKPSTYGGKNIWLCPLDPTHPTKPRE